MKKSFGMLVIGQITSVFGSSLLKFALSLYVLDITGSEVLFGTLLAISNLPILLAPLGGAIADRYSRRNLMVVYDFVNSALVLCLVIAMYFGVMSIPLIGIVLFLLGILAAFETPTVSACVPSLAESDKLESANGVVQGVQALSGILAPILGGVLYGLFGIQILCIFSCVAFILAALLEMFIDIPFVKREQDGGMFVAVAKDLKDGFSYVAKESFIKKVMVFAAILNCILTPMFIVGAPIILRLSMKSSDAMVGIGMGLIQLASIAGALLVGFFTKRMRMKTVYRWPLAIAALTVPIALSILLGSLGIGYAGSFALFMAGSVPIAAAAVILSIFAITKVQKKTPDAHLGKVMAIIQAAAQCTAPVGQFAYGLVFSAFSRTLWLPILAVGALLLMVTLITGKMFGSENDV